MDYYGVVAIAETGDHVYKAPRTVPGYNANTGCRKPSLSPSPRLLFVMYGLGRGLACPCGVGHRGPLQGCACLQPFTSRGKFLPLVRSLGNGSDTSQP